MNMQHVFFLTKHNEESPRCSNFIKKTKVAKERHQLLETTLREPQKQNYAKRSRKKVYTSYKLEKKMERGFIQCYCPRLQREFRVFHFDSLIETFIFEISFPSNETSCAILKNATIPLRPYLPSCDYEQFHEELLIEILFSPSYHLKEGDSKLPL
jgi:hypothetical protein